MALDWQLRSHLYANASSHTHTVDVRFDQQLNYGGDVAKNNIQKMI